MSDINMSLLSKLHLGMKRVGIRGIMKSAYYSSRFTSSLSSLIIGPNVKVDLSSNTEFDINHRLIIGGGFPSSSNTIFATTSGSSISQTGDGMAKIFPDCFLRIEGDFSIGNSWINHGSYIRCQDKITIGDGCAISWNVDIIDYDGHQIKIGGEEKPTYDPINIMDDVWIGYNSSINKGVTIGEGSVIASNSTVVSDIPPNTLAAGSPAEVVRENVTWE